VTAALNMLLGAALVAIGVIAAALADRIRGVKLVREQQPREREQPRERASRAPAADIPVIEAVPMIAPAAPPAKPQRAVAPAKARTSIPVMPERNAERNDGGEDVIAALIGAGYKKPIATEATWACGAGERASIEGWTAAALRRCARGGMS